MKILHIQVLPKLSGVQRVSLDILKNLPNDYQKYIMFSSASEYGDTQECVKQFSEAGAIVLFSDNIRREISLIRDCKAILEIYRLCKRERFDIVHTNSSKPGVVGRIAATLAGVPLVIHTVHGLSFHKFVKFPLWQIYWIIEMFSSLFCDKIVLVNKYYSKYFRWCKGKVSTIYNGVDFDSLKKPEVQSKTDTDVVRILFVGRLDSPKNPLSLLEAAKIVCEKHPNAIFTLVGDGEFFSACNDYIKANNLENNVHLAGWQSDTSQYYANNDILVSSSIYESFGLTFVEAAYFSLPVVATNVEGIPEVVIHNQTGLLCEPNDPSALAQNLIKMIENPQLRREFGEQNRKRCMECFSVQKMVSQYLDFYNSAK